jgi:membrane protein implicated in regulation of membrane protease activity
MIDIAVLIFVLSLLSLMNAVFNLVVLSILGIVAYITLRRKNCFSQKPLTKENNKND